MTNLLGIDLGEVWDDTKNFLGGGLLLNVSPELQEQRDREAQELRERRINDPYGRWDFLTAEESTEEGTWAQILENFMPSIGRFYEGTAQMATNPAKTTKLIGDLTTGGTVSYTHLTLPTKRIV